MSDQLKVFVPVEADTSKAAQTKFQQSLNKLVKNINPNSLPKLELTVSNINSKEAIGKFKREIEQAIGALNSINLSPNLSGSATTEKALDTMTGKTAVLKTNFEKLSDSIVNSSLTKGFDSGSGILTFLTQLIDGYGKLPALIAAASEFSNKGGYAPSIKAAS